MNQSVKKRGRPKKIKNTEGNSNKETDMNLKTNDNKNNQSLLTKVIKKEIKNKTKRGRGRRRGRPAKKDYDRISRK